MVITEAVSGVGVITWDQATRILSVNTMSAPDKTDPGDYTITITPKTSQQATILIDHEQTFTLTILPACSGEYFEITGTANYPTDTPLKYSFTLGDTAEAIADSVTWVTDPVECLA